MKFWDVPDSGFDVLNEESRSRHLQGVAPRGAGETIFRAHVIGELLLQQGGFGSLALGNVVAVQPARAHDGNRPIDGVLRNGFLLGETTPE